MRNIPRERQLPLLPAAPAALRPSAVDAAFDDEALSLTTESGTRRELAAGGENAETVRVAVDRAHGVVSLSPAGDGESGLLRRLSKQLELLEIQQQQIRRLLKQTEERTVRRNRVQS